MSDSTANTVQVTAFEIEGHPTGPQKLGTPGKIFVFAVVPAILAIIAALIAPAFANAADGMADLVLVSPNDAPYTTQVPPEPVITGHHCTIGMQGQGTPGTRLTLKVTLATGMVHTIARTDIGDDGMIREVIQVDHIIPGKNRSVEAQIIEIGFDDGAKPVVRATAHVGNQGDCE